MLKLVLLAVLLFFLVNSAAAYIPVYVVAFASRSDVILTSNSFYKNKLLEQFQGDAVEVCVKYPYTSLTTNPNVFCVDTSSTFAIQPFFLPEKTTIPGRLMATCIGADYYGSGTFYLGACTVTAGFTAAECGCDDFTNDYDSVIRGGVFGNTRSAVYSQGISVCRIRKSSRYILTYVFDDEPCPSGFTLYDMLFVTPATRQCPTFRCPQSNKCLPSSTLVCDGVADCPQGEDEALSACCPGWFCQEEGKCIPATAVCDGVVDCTQSGSDEASCVGEGWTPVAQDLLVEDSLASGHKTVVFDGKPSTALAQCVREAAQANSQLILLADDNSYCQVYSYALARQALSKTYQGAAPRPALIASGVSTTLYWNGGGSALLTDATQCNGRGSYTGSGCICDENYYGFYCESQFNLNSFLLEIIALSTASPFRDRYDPLYLMYDAESAVRTALGGGARVSTIYTHIINKTAARFVAQVPSIADVSIVKARLDNTTTKAALAQDNLYVSIAGPPWTLWMPRSVPGSEPSSLGFPFNPPRRLSGAVFAVENSYGAIELDVVVTGLLATSGGAVSEHLTCNVAAWSCLIQFNQSILISNVTVSGNVSRIYWNAANFFGAVVIPPLQSILQVSNKESTPTSFLISGIVLIVVGSLAAFLAVRFWAKDVSSWLIHAFGLPVEADRSVKDDVAALWELAVRRAPPRTRETVLQDAAGFATLYADPAARRIRDGSRALLVSMIVAIVFGSSLITYFRADHTGVDSNSVVVVEAYATPDGDASLFAPLPLLSIIVPPGKKCSRVEVIGLSPQALFAQASCSEEDIVAHLKYGPTFLSCTNSAPIVTPSNSLVTAAAIFGQLNPNFTLKISCAVKSSAFQRQGFLRAMQNSLPDGNLQTTAITPIAIEPARRQHWDDATLSPGYQRWQYRRIQSRRLSLVSASHDCRFDSVTETDILTTLQNISNTTLLIQTEEAFTTGLSHPQAEAAANTYSTFSGIPDDVKQHTPRDGDVPVGFLYKGAYDASRYYGVRGSYADVGKYFSDNVATADGEGLTISLYLKVTPSAVGFAFAVTDTRESIQTMKSPLLDKLLECLASGKKWYNMSSNVYSALYVNGPSSSLSLVFANSPYNQLGKETKALDTPLVILEWNLDELGVPYLFNDAWHHVNIFLRAEGGQSKAQLVVDGQTSRLKKGWNQCVDRRPLEVDYLRTDMTVPATSALELSRTSGTLFVGYLLGGVAKVEFTPYVKDIFDVWANSTKAIRNRNAIDTTGNIVLASLLFTAGALFLVLCAYFSGKKVKKAREEMQEFLKITSFRKYVDIWKTTPADSQGMLYQPIKWSLAKEILGLNDEVCSAFCDRLVKSSKSPGQNLVQTLYAFLTATAEDADPVINKEQLPDSPALDAAVEKYLADRLTAEKPFTGEDPGDISVIIRAGKNGEGGSATTAVDADYEAMIMDRGRTGAGVDGGHLQFAQAQQLQSQDGDVALTPAAAEKFLELLSPIIVTLQSVYVWLSNLEVPLSYDKTFGELIKTISIDITAAYASIPPVVTPLSQLVASVFILAGLYFILNRDQSLFQWYLARYVLERDRKEFRTTTPATDVEKYKVIAGDDNQAKCDYLFRVPILSREDATRVDELLASNDGDDDERAEFEFDGSKYFCRRKTDDEIAESKDDEVPSVLVEHADEHGVVEDLRMFQVGARCQRHAERRLAPCRQSSIWPPVDRGVCCVEEQGQRCNKSTGVMYRCGESYTNEAGETAVCSFAICVNHFQPLSPIDGLVANEVLSVVRKAQEFGPAWVASTVFFYLANTYYTPFVQTAMMILACSPFFQCMFSSCWDGKDPNFSIAAHLSICVMIFYAVGFPLVLSILLFQRRSQIFAVFFADEYDSKFGSHPDDTAALAEWNRMTVTDPSALATLYSSFTLRWIFITPVICLWKVVLIIPAVFLESGSLNQSIGVAVVEFCFGAFWFITDPSTAPLVDAMYKIGSAHQMIFLGFLNVDVHTRYHGTGSMAIGIFLTTLVYLAICAAGIIYTKVAPLVQSTLQTKKIDKLLESLGELKDPSTKLYVVPEFNTFSRKQSQL